MTIQTVDLRGTIPGHRAFERRPALLTPQAENRTMDGVEQQLPFESLGYARIPMLCTADELEELRKLIPTRANSLRTEVEILDRDMVRGLALHGRARAAVVAVRPGSEELLSAQWYCKPASSPGAIIPWHQDRAFWPPERVPTIVTWIALDDANRANGCMVVRPGSHASLQIRKHAVDEASGIRACSIAGTAESEFMELPAGSGFMYHERLIHRSDGNATSAPRRAIVLGWGEPA